MLLVAGGGGGKSGLGRRGWEREREADGRSPGSGQRSIKAEQGVSVAGRELGGQHPREHFPPQSPLLSYLPP